MRERIAELEVALADRETDLARLQESAERSRGFFEQAPDGCYVCDLMGTFIDGNRAAEEIVGYPREELIGKSFLKRRLLSKGDIVKDVGNRIYAMASAHERLSQSEDLTQIEMGQYLEELAGQLVTPHSGGKDVGLQTDLEPIPLAVDNAICLGLIVNELVTNSLTHGFTPGDKGQLRITLSRSPGGDLLLTIADNGTGLPEDLDWRNSPSLGFHLVSALVWQHGAEIERDEAAGGTCFRLLIPPAAN